MTLEQALAYQVPFGKQYKGWTLQAVAEDGDAGLRWLDFIRDQDWLYGDTKEAINLVADHYQSEIDRATE